MAEKFNAKSFHFSVDIPEIFTILIKISDFRRIFENLIHNSIDAIQENGRITIFAKENLNLDKIDILVILCSGFSDLQLSDGFLPDLIIKKPYNFDYLNHQILELFHNKFN